MNWSMLCCQYLHFVYFLYTSITFQGRRIISKKKKKKKPLCRGFLNQMGIAQRDNWKLYHHAIVMEQQCKSECTWWWQQWLIKVLKCNYFPIIFNPRYVLFSYFINESFLISHVSLNLFYRKDACSDKFLVLTLHYLLELSM